MAAAATSSFYCDRSLSLILLLKKKCLCLVITMSPFGGVASSAVKGADSAIASQSMKQGGESLAAQGGRNLDAAVPGAAQGGRNLDAAVPGASKATTATRTALVGTGVAAFLAGCLGGEALGGGDGGIMGGLGDLLGFTYFKAISGACCLSSFSASLGIVIVVIMQYT
jgi:hypothetical protein